MDNKQKYAEIYAQAFIDSYPELPADRSKELTVKAVAKAVECIDAVNIEGAAFKLTSKRLGIKHTKKAIKEFLSQ